MSDIIRKISCNEQLYLDMQDLMNTFAIQFILEYEGIVDKKKLEDAINYVLNRTNDSNLKLYQRDWVKNSENIVIKDVLINSKEMLEDQFFKQKIDYKTHSVEVYLLKHLQKKYIVFKILHSVSDGKGALKFIENVFKKLNEKELTTCSNKYNEQTLAKEITKHNKVINLIPKYKLDTRINKVKEYIPRWNLISVNGYHIGIISKIALVLSKYFKDNNIKYMIPVDIRRHLDSDNYLGNMTLPIFLKASKKDTWQEINGKLLYALKNKEELNKKSLQYLGYQKMPYNVRKCIIKVLGKYFNLSNKFSTGSIISYLGRIDIKNYSTDTFNVVDFVSLPLQQPTAPFSIVVTEVKNKTNIAISSYMEQIEKSKFDEISNRIKDILEYEIYEEINNRDNQNIVDCVYEIDKQIQECKESVGIEENNKKYTYKDINNRVNDLMRKIKKEGVNQQDNVILYMKRSIDFVCAVLACMRLDITFIPVDESTNKNRIIDIIKDSNCKLVILKDLDIDYEVKKLKVNYNYTEIKHCKQENIIHKPNDIAYKIYTSGTTGKPKGIEISYNNLSNYLTWAKETYKTKTVLKMPLFTSLSVDLTLTSILLPLISGGAIKILEKQFSSNTLEEILKDKEINVIKATPTHLSLINKNVKTNVEKIIVGGENFNSKLAENISCYFNNNVTIYNEYGPTETTIGCTYEVFKHNDFLNVPIGVCINNTKAYLLDDNNNIVTSEEKEGEIIIAGEGVSQGLLNSNSKSLININEELFYKTGDLGFIKNKVLHCIRKKRLSNKN